MSKRAATGVVVRSHEEEDVNELRARVNELEATLVRLQEEKESIYKDSREKANKISKLQNQLKTLKGDILLDDDLSKQEEALLQGSSIIPVHVTVLDDELQDETGLLYATPQPTGTNKRSKKSKQAKVADDGTPKPIVERRVARPWTRDEENALMEGIDKHKVGSWSDILHDPELGGRFFERTNVDLKDKYRNLMKAKKRSNSDNAGAPEHSLINVMDVMSTPPVDHH